MIFIAAILTQSFLFQLSFLNRREDGTTALCVLNTDNDGIGKLVT